MTQLDKPYGTGDEFERFLVVGTVLNGAIVRKIIIPMVSLEEGAGTWATVIEQLLTSIDLALPDDLADDGGLKVHVLNPGGGSSFDVGAVDQGEPGTEPQAWYVRLNDEQRAMLLGLFAKTPDLGGDFSYIGDNGAGQGTANVPAGKRIVGAACWTESASGARFRIDGGDWVSLPSSGDGMLGVLGGLTGPIAVDFEQTGGFAVTLLAYP